MRNLSLCVVASLFALSSVACGGEVSDVGNAPSGRNYSGTGGGYAILPSAGGALTAPASKTTGGSSAAVNYVAGGATGDAVSAPGGASYGNPILVNGFDIAYQTGIFRPDPYMPTDCSANAALVSDAGGTVSIDWSGSVDVNADATLPGSMKVTVTFAGWNQFIDLEMGAPTDANGNPIDLTNKLVTAMIRIKQGVSPQAPYPYGAVLYVKTGSDYVWGDSGWTNMTSTSGWVTLALDATSPQDVPANGLWDPSQPTSLGIQLSTGGGGESTYCGLDYTVPFGPPQTTVFYIDNIQISSRP